VRVIHAVWIGLRVEACDGTLDAKPGERTVCVLRPAKMNCPPDDGTPLWIGARRLDARDDDVFAPEPDIFSIQATGDDNSVAVGGCIDAFLDCGKRPCRHGAVIVVAAVDRVDEHLVRVIRLQLLHPTTDVLPIRVAVAESVDVAELAHEDIEIDDPRGRLRHEVIRLAPPVAYSSLKDPVVAFVRARRKA